MSFVFVNVAVIAVVFALMVALEAWGRRLGEEHRRRDPQHDKTGYGAAEAAVFALLGLFIAFTFSGAAGRFDNRRQLIGEETNAIGTAWLRIDMLPLDRQPKIRDLFRRYLDARLDSYRLLPDRVAAGVAAARATSLQGEIWTASAEAATSTSQTPPAMLLLPAVNAMIDITTTRVVESHMHPPVVVYAMVAVLALVGSIFVGYGTSGHVVRSRVHTFGFAVVLAMVMFVIVELEFPRFGLIRLDPADHVLVDLRRSMG